METPPFPKALTYLWQTYIRLRRRTPVGMSGPQPITWSDIDAFVRRTGHHLAPWEIVMIETIDDIFLQAGSNPTAANGQTPSRDGSAVRSILGAVGVRRSVKRKREAAHG